MDAKTQHDYKEAVAMLEGALPKLEPDQSATISAFAEQCREHLVPDARA